MKRKTRTIFIGDIHGCIKELKLLIEKLKVEKSDTLYCTGDLIMKGPSSIKVLQYCKDNHINWIKGNKEHELLHAINSGSYYTKEEKKLGEKLLKNHKDLIKDIEKAPYYIDTPDFLLVHGGIVPGLTIKKQSPRDLCYLREYEGKPWYEYYQEKKKVIYGHWAYDGLQINKNTIGLDSGCVYGGSLTAYILETGKIINQKALKIYKNPHKKGSISHFYYRVEFLCSKLSSGK